MGHGVRTAAGRRGYSSSRDLYFAQSTYLNPLITISTGLRQFYTNKISTYTLASGLYYECVVISDMDVSDEYEEKIANKIESIHELELEALRRAGVAKEKEQGLEIESTEAVRLFREATGYILRLRELRDDIEVELARDEKYHAERIIGHIDDYNRILSNLRRNPSFENSIKSFNDISYQEGPDIYTVNMDGRKIDMKTVHTDAFGRNSSVPMNDSNVEVAILPRLVRLTKEVENSIIGRCASGKRPD